MGLSIMGGRFHDPDLGATQDTALAGAIKQGPNLNLFEVEIVPGRH